MCSVNMLLQQQYTKGGVGGGRGGNGAIYVCSLNIFLNVFVKHCEGGHVFVHMHVSYTQMYMYRHMFTL